MKDSKRGSQVLIYIIPIHPSMHMHDAACFTALNNYIFS